MTTILPQEVLHQIFSYLDPRSLAAVSQCSTTFYRVATTPAFWELPYLLRWTTGNPQREADRGVTPWRRQRKLQRLTDHARRAAAEKGLPAASSSESPFRYLQLDQHSAGSGASHLELDFYRLFLERIKIDQEVLDTLYEQVEATHGRILAVTSLARKFGNDAKDVLTAVVEAQSSCPSWSSNGLPLGRKAAKSREDPLAYDPNTYRINAYRVHLPTTLRSETHHLVILHHAREMLEHLQRREAMQKLSSMSQETQAPRAASAPSISIEDSLPRQTETAVSLLTMFRGGERTYVESQLDVLAAACDLYLQARLPSSSATSRPLDRAKETAMAICDFLADHGFRGARDDLFSDLDNHFLHHCFTTNRETLPLSLTLIFCGVANRLGLVASLCNFPMRILAFIMADPTSKLPGEGETLQTAPQVMFWLDVCEYTSVAYDAHDPTSEDLFARRTSWLQERPPVLDREDLTEWIGRMGVPPSDDFWRPATPGSMVQRAARNILGSVQRAQIAPRNVHPVGQARHAIRAMEVSRRSARLEGQWRGLVRVDHAFLSSYHGRTDGGEHEDITASVAKALDPNTVELDEDETTWTILKMWRAESLRTLTAAPETWTQPVQLPSHHFRAWMAQRAMDNDWTLTRSHLHRRADHWSEHEQQAAKYAAVNAFLRLSTHVNAREVDWIAGFLQSYFMLDVEVVERDFLGIVYDEQADREEVEDDESEGSDSSTEASFSARQVREGTETRDDVPGIVTNPSARIILRRMLQAVRTKDAEAPRVNRRPKTIPTRKRQLPTSPNNTSSENEKVNGTSPAETPVGYRIGTVFRHRTYRYVGSLLGWDPYCAAPEDWIVNMGVDRLPAPSSASTRGGRHQPFYHSQVADGTRRYVAEVNIEPISGPIWVYGRPEEGGEGGGEEVVEEGRALGGSVHRMLELRGLGEYFRCFDQRKGRLRRCRDARVMFPDDWSDEEGGDWEEKEEEEENRDDKVVERLSEDASW